MIFMAYVYTILSSQPFLVAGIHDYDLAKTNAMGALITFATLFGICIFLIFKAAGSSSDSDKEGGGREYDDTGDDYNRLNIDLKKNYGEQKIYGSVATDSY